MPRENLKLDADDQDDDDPMGVNVYRRPNGVLEFCQGDSVVMIPEENFFQAIPELAKMCKYVVITKSIQ